MICLTDYRYLLGFGTVTQYVGYSALTDFFPTMTMRPNPHCQNSHCRHRQQAAHVSVTVHVSCVYVCTWHCVCRQPSKLN